MANCIFCKIANGESPARIRYEDDDVVAFDDINPKAPVHILVVTKRHLKSMSDLRGSDEKLIGHLMMIIKKVAEESGYKVVINTGKEAGQLVDHLHAHILGGKLLARMAV